MHATSINPIDWKLREGYLQEGLPFDFPIILGWDVASVVKEGFLWLEPDGQELAQLGKLIEEGKLNPHVGGTFPLTEQGMKEAHQLSETHHAKGKIAIKIK